MNLPKFALENRTFIYFATFIITVMGAVSEESWLRPGLQYPNLPE
jgi:hypothetical protein